MPPEELFARLSEADWFVSVCEYRPSLRSEEPCCWHLRASHFDGRGIVYAISQRPTLQEALEALAEKCGVDIPRASNGPDPGGSG